MSDDLLLDPALQDPTPLSGQATPAVDDSLIQPDLDTAQDPSAAPALPPVKDTHSTRSTRNRKGERDAAVEASVVEDALSGLVSMIQPNVDEVSSHSGPAVVPSFLERENATLKAELVQAKLTIARLEAELANAKPKPPPKAKAPPPPKPQPARRGSIPPDDHVLQNYRNEVRGWVRPVYDPSTLVHVTNFAASERQETNLRVAFGSIDGHVPDEAEWKAWIAERLRLVDDILDGAKTWAQQPEHLKELAMNVAEKRWAPLGLCDESRWKAVEFLSRRQEQRLKKPRVPKSQQKKRELSEVGGNGSARGRNRSESVADSPQPSGHHINEDGDIEISPESPISNKRPRLDLLVDPALQQLLQQHAAEEEAAGRHNFVLGDAAALVAQHENNNHDIEIDVGDQGQGATGDVGVDVEDTTFDHLDPALHAAVSSSFADATALVEGMTALQGMEGIEGLDYELPDDLSAFDSAQFTAQIESQLNEQLHSQLLDQAQGEATSPNSKKEKKTVPYKGPEAGTPEAEVLLNANKHKSLEQFRAMGGRVLGDLCGAAGLFSRSGSIQQKAKRIYDFFQHGIGLTAPTGEEDSSVEPHGGRSESAELQFGPDGDYHVGSHDIKTEEDNAEIEHDEEGETAEGNDGDVHV